MSLISQAQQQKAFRMLQARVATVPKTRGSVIQPTRPAPLQRVPNALKKIAARQTPQKGYLVTAIRYGGFRFRGLARPKVPVPYLPTAPGANLRQSAIAPRVATVTPQAFLRKVRAKRY